MKADPNVLASVGSPPHSGKASAIVVVGGPANDTLSGGADNDWFIFNNDGTARDLAVDLAGMEQARVVDID